MPDTRTESPARIETNLLIVFVDLTRFGVQSRRVDDVVSAAGGRVLKFMGDGILIVFEEDKVDGGVEALLDPSGGSAAAGARDTRLSP